MSFIDIITLHLKAGDGGDGVVSFRREKYEPHGGPDGGNGGRGGHIYLRATKNLQSLTHLKVAKLYYEAKSGKNGMSKNMHGASGKDLIIDVPIGTIVMTKNKEPLHDLSIENEQYLIAKGGNGGFGNKMFSSSINRTPRQANTGLSGESIDVTLELKLIAEVGLIGLPNAGKSSLLKCLTKANAKIGNYPFTTLFPNLGTLKTMDREIILADIPGIIEGASSGEGLGFDFLKHIQRTKILLHLIEATIEPEICFNNYLLIQNELSLYSNDLVKKNTLVIISKSDLVDTSKLNDILQFFKEKNIAAFAISSFTSYHISSLIEKILNLTSD